MLTSSGWQVSVLLESGEEMRGVLLGCDATMNVVLKGPVEHWGAHGAWPRLCCLLFCDLNEVVSKRGVVSSGVLTLSRSCGKSLARCALPRTMY